MNNKEDTQVEFEEALPGIESRLKELQERFPGIDVSTPEGWAEACKHYAEIVRPGIEAVERERRRSLAVAHRIIVR